MPSMISGHINAALTDLAVGYQAPATVADTIFPSVGVQKQSDYYWIVDPERADLKTADDRRGEGGYPNTIDWTNSTDTYAVREHILEDLVTDAQRANADVAIKPDIEAVRQLQSKLALIKEIEAAAKIVAGVSGAAASKVWTDQTGDPIADVQTQLAAVEDALGVTPNVGWCDKAVYRALRNHAAIKAHFKSGVLTQGEIDRNIADILGLERIVICKSMKNTSKNATPSLSAVWGKGFYVGYVSPAMGLKTLSLGLTFDWTGVGGAGWAVKTLRDERAGGDRHQVARWYEQKIVVAAAGRKITGCLS